MRIGICISGHFKYYQKIYKNFLEYLYEPLTKHGPVDVIISTWSKLHTKYSISTVNNECPPEMGDTDANDILNKYRAKVIQITDFDSIKDNFHVKKYFTEDKDYKFYPTHITDGIFTSFPMFYQWYLCNQLKKEQERLGGFTYDWVIKLRPDIFWLQEKSFDNINPNNFYNRNLHSDFFYLSSSKNIDMLCDIYLHLKRIIKENFNDSRFNFVPYCSEYFLEHYFEDNNISKDIRKEFGEDWFYFFPRKYFLASCYETLKKVGKENELQGILSKYNL